MNIPGFAKLTRVDVMIECYRIADSTRDEMLRLMPDAYCGEAPGEDDWPDPDHTRNRPFLFKVIRESLSEEAKADINHAWETRWTS